MHKFEKMMEKKKKMGKEMSPVEKDAKMSVVNELRDMASNEMGKRLGGLKKVSVMSDSKHGLEEGLEKAKELMHKGPMGEPSPADEESMDHEKMESPEEEASEGENDHSHMSEDEIDEKLQELMAMKKKMGSHKKMV